MSNSSAVVAIMNKWIPSFGLEHHYPENSMFKFNFEGCSRGEVATYVLCDIVATAMRRSDSTITHTVSMGNAMHAVMLAIRAQSCFGGKVDLANYAESLTAIERESCLRNAGEIGFWARHILELRTAKLGAINADTDDCFHI